MNVHRIRQLLLTAHCDVSNYMYLKLSATQLVKHIYGGFLKWWYLTTMGFSYKKWSFWGVLGVPPFKERGKEIHNLSFSAQQLGFFQIKEQIAMKALQPHSLGVSTGWSNVSTFGWWFLLLKWHPKKPPKMVGVRFLQVTWKQLKYHLLAIFVFWKYFIHTSTVVDSGCMRSLHKSRQIIIHNSKQNRGRFRYNHHHLHYHTSFCHNTAKTSGS